MTFISVPVSVKFISLLCDHVGILFSLQKCFGFLVNPTPLFHMDSAEILPFASNWENIKGFLVPNSDFTISLGSNYTPKCFCNCEHKPCTHAGTGTPLIIYNDSPLDLITKMFIGSGV